MFKDAKCVILNSLLRSSTLGIKGVIVWGPKASDKTE